MAHMFTCFVFALAVSSANGHAVLHVGRAFLSASMQPEVVAHTLVGVEEEWMAQVAVAVQCNMSTFGRSVNCSDAPVSFAKSCSRVLGAIVQGSSGDLSVAEEYMTDVCSQPIMIGLQRQHCVLLAQSLLSGLTADSYENRVNFEAQSSCSNLWTTLVDEERNAQVVAKEKRQAAEKAAHEAAEQKMAAEEKLTREAAETAKHAEEQTAQEAVAKQKKLQETVAQNNTNQEENKADEKEVKNISREEVKNQKLTEPSRKITAEATSEAIAEKETRTQSEAEKVAKAAEEKLNEVDQIEHSHEEEMANLTGRIFNASAVREHMVSPIENNTVVMARNATK